MAKTLEEQRAEVAEKAAAIANGAKASARSLTSDEVGQIREFVEEIKGFDVQLKNATDAENLLASISSPAGYQKSESGLLTPSKANTIGAHFYESVKDQLVNAKGQRFSISAPEFGSKAASDTHATNDFNALLLPPQYDFNIVRQVRRRLFLTDWLGAGNLTASAITYFVEKADSAIEGAFTTVAEEGQKPQLHMPDYDPVTETLKKIAGFIKLSDEMLEDAAFLVSEIEQRLMWQLMLFEENQLLNGNGVGTNVLGLLNRSGLQTETAADNTDNFDAIFRAMTKVETGSDLAADGIVINPIDYQNLRLSKDGNDQYIAGGPFQGQYGVGGILENPPIWGRTTIVTPAIAAGTVLVGNGAQASTVYRKGGVRVEATNSNVNDFEFNRVTVRAEERVALAVRKPAAYAKVTLSNVAPTP